LVSGNSDEVGVVDVLPVPVIGEVFPVEKRRSALNEGLSVFVFDTAWVREGAFGSVDASQKA
jgi:hypothetical protein